MRSSLSSYNKFIKLNILNYSASHKAFISVQVKIQVEKL